MAIQTLSGDNQTYNAFTLESQKYSVFYKLGGYPGDAQSTPKILYGATSTETDTQRFAVRMPSIGTLRKVQVYYKSKTAGDANGTFDFRLYETPWGANRDELFDKLYEKKNIVFGVPWVDVFPDGLPFANRVGTSDSDPSTGKPFTFPRNFLWMELKPNDATVDTPIVWVSMLFDMK